MLLSDLFEQYAERYLPVIIDQARFRSCMRILQEALGGAIEVESITHQTLLDYRAKSGKKQATINKELVVLSSALKWSQRNGLTSHEVSIPLVREKTHHQSLNEEQVQQLIDRCREYRGKAFIALMFITGQRKAAIQNLKWSQIVNGVIEFEADGDARASRRKRRARTPVTKELGGVLESISKVFGSTEYVIPGKSGLGCCKQLDRYFGEAVARCSFRATPHTIRHTAATISIAKGNSLYETSRFLGHSSIRITEDTYIHGKPEHISGAVSMMGGLVSL